MDDRGQRHFEFGRDDYEGIKERISPALFIKAFTAETQRTQRLRREGNRFVFPLRPLCVLCGECFF